MECRIITKTPNMLDVVYAAARTCYSKFTPAEIFEKDISTNKKIELLNRVICSNHTSVCEHGYFTFAIAGVSRSLLAQLTRHRIASYSVQSQRYVDFSKIVQSASDDTELVNMLCIIPDDVKETEERLNKYINSCASSIRTYCSLIELGVKPEDARHVLPESFKTNLVCTFNIRSLMNFMEERLCNRAQKEIRDLAFLMRQEIIKDEEWLAQYLLPHCIKNKKCKEETPCGKKAPI